MHETVILYPTGIGTDAVTIVAIAVSSAVGLMALSVCVYFIHRIYLEKKQSTYSRIIQMNVY